MDDCGHNFHADHHIYHMKNFGIYNCLMDMYFGTRYVIFNIHNTKGTTAEIETKTKTKCNVLLSKDVPFKIIQLTSLKTNIYSPKVDGKFFI